MFINPRPVITQEQLKEFTRINMERAEILSKFRFRLGYLARLICDQYKCKVAEFDIYGDSLHWVGLRSQPLLVSVVLNPKNKKITLRDKGVVMPDGEVFLWNVLETRRKDPKYQDFHIPCSWMYDDTAEEELKEGIKKWNLLSKEEKKKHLDGQKEDR